MSRTPKFLLAAVLPILFLPGFAQPSPSAPSQSIVVNVLDRNGNAVRDLTKDNFHVKINKQPVVVLAANYGLAPRRIIVLLDMSGSMGGKRDTNKWRIAREAVEDLIAQTPPDVPIALLTFSDQVHDVFDFRESRSAIARWFREGPTEQTSLKGRTALHDAILVSLRMLRPYRSGDAAYVITDGGDNASHVSFDQTKTALRESGVRLYALLFPEFFPTGEEIGGVDSLVKLAGDSGGFVFGISGRGALGVSFLPSWGAVYDYNDRTREKIKIYTQALNSQVHGFYTVQVAVSLPQGKAAKVALEIVDAAGNTRKDVGYTFQRELTAQGK
jgi:hypothetical protein